MGCFVSKRSRGGAGVQLAAADPGPKPRPADAACATSAAAAAPALPPVVPFPPTATSGWPAWLAEAAGDALDGWSPRRADSFQKLDKIGQGTYSNVYKARDLVTGKVVALKKVRFDIMELESVRFMAREISVLRRLNHPNVVRLEGLVTSRVSNSIYLIFEYMEHDLAGLVASPDIKFTEPQVKCYMKQLLSGLEHCHNRGVLHRDIKGSNLLLDNEGILKIADFGLASTFDPDHKQSMTSRVVTLWYRPPELLLGATYYGVGVDLWSAGCILGELLSGKAILPGRTEVEQLHKIFKLCGSPGEKYWKKAKLPHATMFKPNQAYKRCVAETFKDFSPSALLLIETLLAVDPAERGTATAALNSEFFSTEPYACEPSTLPHYPPSKELDARLRDEKARRQRRNDAKGKAQGRRKARVHDHLSKAVPAPEANAELQVNLNRRMMARMNVATQSEKFPPPHQDGAVGITTASFVANDTSFTSSLFEEKVEMHQNGPHGTDRKNRARKEEPHTATSRASIRHLRNSSIGLLMELRKNTRIHWKNKDKESEVFGAEM